MYLSHILKSEEILSPEKHANTEIAKPIADSRKIEKNDVFFCEDGFYESGFSYAARAVDAGAAACLRFRSPFWKSKTSEKAMRAHGAAMKTSRKTRSACLPSRERTERPPSPHSCTASYETQRSRRGSSARWNIQTA